MTAPCTIQLHAQPFEPLEALAAWQRQLQRQLQRGLSPTDLGTTAATPGATDTGSVHGGANKPTPAMATNPAWELPAAEAHFIGRVRGTTATGKPLEALELEHYPGMTETQLQLLSQGCAERHGAQAVLVVHRVGRILPGEAIVLVAVAADRRGPAQRCGQELLELLKHEAPFWKREWSCGEGGSGAGTWVEGNTTL